MAAKQGSSGQATGRAGSAWLHAARAGRRAVQQGILADQHERLAALTADRRTFHESMASIHRGTERRHLAAAQLHDARARRMSDWPQDRAAPPLGLAEVAETCETPSAALALIGADHRQLAVSSSDQLSRSALDLEYILGLGPATDAAKWICTVSASGPAVDGLWPGYGSELAALGALSVIAVPLTSEGICIGTLAVFDPPPDLAGSGILAWVADALTDGLQLGPDANPELYETADLRPVVNQAAGLLSERIPCPIGDALSLIRARAYAEATSPETIARRIVSGELKIN
ncbi:GAF domain-containing protein [Streptomyces beijiangensis]|uniref:GAF domain-containing protein n=1 Tax=Streptomyces beijiangensis TaxID=163361 RepID=A0A939F3M9_9ACTN|nr:GAF domain-containing protein [Streptomyces beijiangensis]MBO0511507.1 GAF domain-containing protein [Streptomyces beijiangensis]